MRTYQDFLLDKPLILYYQVMIPLSKRPMNRVIEPLSLMGAKIYGNIDGHCPINIKSSAFLIQ